MLNIGIIGAGRIGKVHLQSVTRYVTDAKVIALADPFMNAETEEWARSLGVGKLTRDYKEILADPEVDAVFICSSTDTHSAISLEAIAAGKHIFCEKPVDHDLGKIKAVMQALEGSPVKYQVGFNRRFDHNFAAAREAVANGRIGELAVLKITSRDPGAPPVDYIKVSGGIFLDMTIHDFDMVRFISGEEVAEVYAAGGVTVDPAIGEAGDIDTAVVTLRLESGALAVIDNCRRASYGYDQRLEAFGSKGQVAISNDTASSAVVSDASGVTAEKPLYFFLERYMQAYAAEVEAFVAAVRDDTPVPVGIDAGLPAVLLGVAATQSRALGRPDQLSQNEF